MPIKKLNWPFLVSEQVLPSLHNYATPPRPFAAYVYSVLRRLGTDIAELWSLCAIMTHYATIMPVYITKSSMQLLCQLHNCYIAWQMLCNLLSLTSTWQVQWSVSLISTTQQYSVALSSNYAASMQCYDVAYIIRNRQAMKINYN